MIDPCNGGNLGRLADCREPIILQPLDYYTMNTSAQFQVLVVVVLIAAIWTFRRWSRKRAGAKKIGLISRWL